MVIGLRASGPALMRLAGGSIRVSSWAVGITEFRTGQWVVLGEPTLGRYLRSFVWGWRVPPSQVLSDLVAVSRISNPKGAWEWWQWFWWGHYRIY